MTHNGRHVTIAAAAVAQRQGERLKALLKSVLNIDLGDFVIGGTGPHWIDGISYQLGTSTLAEDALVAAARCSHCGHMRFHMVLSQAALGVFIADVRTGRECPACAGGRR